MASSPYLKINDLRGGVNDADSPFSLLDTEVVEAVNVDYRSGQIGSKRGGCAPIAVTNSVFERLVPVLDARDTGGGTGAASYNVPTTVSGGPNTNQLLIVTIAANQAVNASDTVTYGGVAMTLLGTVSNGAAVTTRVWYMANPALSGTVTVTFFAGASDASIIVERWDRTDLAIGLATSTGATSLISISTAGINSQYMVLTSVAFGAATITFDAIGVFNTSSVTNGAARLGNANKLGMVPTTLFQHTLSGAVNWAAARIVIRGKTGNPIMRWVGRHQPTNDVTNDELWAQDVDGRLDRRVSGTWQGGVAVQNYKVGSFFTTGFGTNAVSLHGKFFIALRGTTYADRTHVWTGIVLRWAGFSTAAALTSVTNTAAGGAYSTTRYFRYRNVEQVAGAVVRRSEPSAVTTFSPSGANSGALINRPADGGFVDGEGATHWELEASVDNNLFYRIQTIVIGTTTATDTTAYNGTSTYSSFALSEALTEYTPLQAVHHLVVDEDRLLGGGSPYVAVNDSRVVWTPLRADLGVGNDERIPATNRFFKDLDGLNGGNITMMSPAVMGGIHVYKLGRVYKLIRTGKPSAAYDSVMLTPARGTTLRGASEGTDENGQPCTYFYDPNVGACRIGRNGIEDLMQKRRTLAQRINPLASLPVCVVFYPRHWLVWYSMALDANLTPNYIACFNVRTRSWTDYTGPMASMSTGTLFPNATNQITPIIAPVTQGTSPLVRADSGVNDDGVRFRGYVRTKAYVLGDLFAEFEIDGTVIHAKAASATVQTRLIRDLSLEIKNTENVSIAGSGESYVTVSSDDAVMAELEQIQFEVGDPVAFSGSQLDQTWQLEALSIRRTSGSENG